MQSHGDVGHVTECRLADRRNARLHSAMKAAGLTFTELAEKSGCHLKTVQRWYYEGRVPRPARAQRIAAVLGTSVGWLWPATAKSHAGELGDHAQLFSRLDGEADLLAQGILTSARRGLDICSGNAWFLERVATSALRYAKNVPLRVLVPPVVIWNGGCSPEELGLNVRTHMGVGQLSLLRGDDAMLIIQSIGIETAIAPALFLSRSRVGARLIDWPTDSTQCGRRHMITNTKKRASGTAALFERTPLVGTVAHTESHRSQTAM